MLAAGGVGESSAELLEARADTGQLFWRQLAPMSTQRCGAQAVSLGDGRALVIGGSRLGGRVVLNTAEVISTGDVDAEWASVAPMYTARVNFAASVVLRDGADFVVVAGGELGQAAATSTKIGQTAEVYDVAADVWSAMPSLAVQRFVSRCLHASAGSNTLFYVDK